jgi:murein DD-endopeptidase MepM/ murein hydrolase activator NlpD
LHSSPLQTLAKLVLATSQSLSNHPRRVLGGIGLVLLGTGVTAFGIAPLAPDASRLPVSNIIEPMRLDAASTQPLGAAIPFTLFRTDTVRRDDSFQSLLKRLGVQDTDAQAFLSKSPDAARLFNSRFGKTVTVETTDRGELLKLTARWLPDDERLFERLTVEAVNGEFAARIESAELAASSKLSSGVIRSSLFAATDEINLPDSVAVQVAEIFASEIDFRRDLRQGDRFNVVFESLEADGETMRAGRVLSAEFVNNGRQHEAVWFEEGGLKGAYFGFNGESSRKSFLSSPLEFSRVSSGYGMRFHPVLGRQKAHLGVDYAAPTGTPVRTIADGVVKFAGVQRGYGNVIEVAHSGNKVTKFAHLSRIGVKQGQRVAQGDFIGAVGTTGLSTGPHLHFEFIDNGAHQDPLAIARKSENIPISPALRERFDAVAVAQRQQLDAAATMVQASAQ